MSKQKLILDRPGVKACGPYEAGVVVTIDDDKEAERLIKVKGFRKATPADEKPADDKPAPAAAKKNTETEE